MKACKAKTLLTDSKSSTALVSQLDRSTLKDTAFSKVPQSDVTAEVVQPDISLLKEDAFEKVWNKSSTPEVSQLEMLPLKADALVKTSDKFLIRLTSKFKSDEKDEASQNI